MAPPPAAREYGVDPNGYIYQVIEGRHVFLTRTPDIASWTPVPAPSHSLGMPLAYFNDSNAGRLREVFQHGRKYYVHTCEVQSEQWYVLHV